MPRRTSKALATVPPATVAPVQGEQTKRQGRFDIASAFGGIPGFNTPLPGSYEIYRLMRANPTIAIARMAAMAPIKAAEWSVEPLPNAPPGAKELIDECLLGDPMHLMVRDMLRAFDYGHQSFEIVWGTKAFQTTEGVTVQRVVPVKIKPLSVDITEILVDAEHGNFAGLRQGQVDLELPYSILFTYDGEAGDLYGRSRNENCRKEWSAWNDLVKRIGQYTNKVAGVIPMVRYPPGESKDKSGAMKDNFEIASSILANLGKGAGIAWPVEMSQFMEDLLRAGAKVEDLYAWSIQFLEPRGSHEAGFDTLLGGLDKYLIRGWLVTERSITEGSHGTLAEAEAHGDVVLTSAEETTKDIAITLNRQLVDSMLRFNWGREAVGTVKLSPGRLIDEKARTIRNVVSALMQPGAPTLPAIAAVVDLDAMLDQAGLPRKKDAAPLVINPPAPALPMLPAGPGGVGGGQITAAIGPHKFSSTQANLAPEVGQLVLAEAAKIPDADLADEGRETEPHITVKYGLHTDDAAEVRDALLGVGPFTVTIGETSLFENDEADVVKLDVEGDALHALNKRIADELDHTDTKPKYIPHITLAYVKPGLGKKYAGNANLKGQAVTIDRVVFSDRQGRRSIIRLTAPSKSQGPMIAAIKDIYGHAGERMKKLQLAKAG